MINSLIMSCNKWVAILGLLVLNSNGIIAGLMFTMTPNTLLEDQGNILIECSASHLVNQTMLQVKIASAYDENEIFYSFQNQTEVFRCPFSEECVDSSVVEVTPSSWHISISLNYSRCSAEDLARAYVCLVQTPGGAPLREYHNLTTRELLVGGASANFNESLGMNGLRFAEGVPFLLILKHNYNLTHVRYQCQVDNCVTPPTVDLRIGSYPVTKKRIEIDRYWQNNLTCLHSGFLLTMPIELPWKHGEVACTAACDDLVLLDRWESYDDVEAEVSVIDPMKRLLLLECDAEFDSSLTRRQEVVTIWLREQEPLIKIWSTLNYTLNDPDKEIVILTQEVSTDLVSSTLILSYGCDIESVIGSYRCMVVNQMNHAASSEHIHITEDDVIEFVISEAKHNMNVRPSRSMNDLSITHNATGMEPPNRQRTMGLLHHYGNESYLNESIEMLLDDHNEADVTMLHCTLEGCYSEPEILFLVGQNLIHQGDEEIDLDQSNCLRRQEINAELGVNSSNENVACLSSCDDQTFIATWNKSSGLVHRKSHPTFGVHLESRQDWQQRNKLNLYNRFALPWQLFNNITWFKDGALIGYSDALLNNSAHELEIRGKSISSEMSLVYRGSDYAFARIEVTVPCDLSDELRGDYSAIIYGQDGRFGFASLRYVPWLYMRDKGEYPEIHLSMNPTPIDRPRRFRLICQVTGCQALLNITLVTDHDVYVSGMDAVNADVACPHLDRVTSPLVELRDQPHSAVCSAVCERDGENEELITAWKLDDHCLFNPCNGRGKCISRWDGNGFRCECFEGWSGPRCSQRKVAPGLPPSGHNRTSILQAILRCWQIERCFISLVSGLTIFSFILFSSLLVAVIRSAKSTSGRPKKHRRGKFGRMKRYGYKNRRMNLDPCKSTTGLNISQMEVSSCNSDSITELETSLKQFYTGSSMKKEAPGSTTRHQGELGDINEEPVNSDDVAVPISAAIEPLTISQSRRTLDRARLALGDVRESISRTVAQFSIKAPFARMLSSDVKEPDHVVSELEVIGCDKSEKEISVPSIVETETSLDETNDSVQKSESRIISLQDSIKSDSDIESINIARILPTANEAYFLHRKSILETKRAELAALREDENNSGAKKQRKWPFRGSRSCDLDAEDRQQRARELSNEIASLERLENNFSNNAGALDLDLVEDKDVWQECLEKSRYMAARGITHSEYIALRHMGQSCGVYVAPIYDRIDKDLKSRPLNLGKVVLPEERL